MSKLLSGIHEAIGDTKMVHLSRLTASLAVEGNIFANLEHLNPGFSKKDRVALQMIEEAEAQGLLVKGQHLVRVN